MPTMFGLPGPDSIWKARGWKPAGFLSGLWHGLILPFSFLFSLFSPRCRIYETNNRGVLYVFGFVLDASIHVTVGER